MVTYILFLYHYSGIMYNIEMYDGFYYKGTKILSLVFEDAAELYKNKGKIFQMISCKCFLSKIEFHRHISTYLKKVLEYIIILIR